MFPSRSLLAICLCSTFLLARSDPSNSNDNPEATSAEHAADTGLLKELATAFAEIGDGLTQAYDAAQKALQSEQNPDGSNSGLFQMNWKFPQWPWSGDNGTQPPEDMVPTKRNPLSYSLDGYLELLVDRHIRRQEYLPGSAYGYLAPRKKIYPQQLRFVENSGVCESTKGVYQASGYADLTRSEHMWFWFFAAREDPDNAPLAIWINGGPGSSSMNGLFDSHGPCMITKDGKDVTLNPNAWNNRVNMLFIDQPIGVGFSYGNLNVGTTALAAADFWSMLQIFFSDPKFAKYKDRPLGLFTESYGGHFGPSFAAYFLSQNEKIRAGELEGIIINFKALGVGNGLTDAVHQYEGYIDYADGNPYRALVEAERLAAANVTFFKGPISCKAGNKLCELLPPSCRLLGLTPGQPVTCPESEQGDSSFPSLSDLLRLLKELGPNTGCRSRILYCQIAELLSSIRVPRLLNPFHSMCSNAQNFCNDDYWGPLADIKGNPYYVIDPDDVHELPNIEPFLDSEEIHRKIGAESKFVLASMDVFNNFAQTGDWMYSFVENLESVIDAGVPTIIFNGDADFVVNFPGAEKLVDYLNIEPKNRVGKIPQINYTVNGEVAGTFKTSGTFSYLRIYGAGHAVPKYGWDNFKPGEVALKMFEQMMFEGTIHST